MPDHTATTAQTVPDFKWDFFLAHAGADLEAARKLKRELEPPAEVFLDADDISLGQNWDRVLAEALRSSLIHVIIVSPNTEEAYYQCEEIAVAIQMDVLACASSFIAPYFDGEPMLTSILLSPPNHRPPNTNKAPTTRITKITRTATMPVLAVLLPLSAISFPPA
jgi:hypothetical protein